MRFAREGARVIGVSVSDNAQKVAAASEPPFEGRRRDVSDPVQVAALFEHCRTEFGRLDVLVNNAAVTQPTFPRMHEVSLAEWDRIIGVNQRGAFLVMKHALRLMLESGGGSLINMASVGSFRASPNASAYLASKGALLTMTRAAALEYAQDNIRVNAVCPGTTRTAIFDGVSPDRVAQLSARSPYARMTEPEEVANLTLFLASDEASAINGAAYLIDGGRCAGG